MPYRGQCDSFEFLPFLVPKGESLCTPLLAVKMQEIGGNVRQYNRDRMESLPITKPSINQRVSFGPVYVGLCVRKRRTEMAPR